MAEFEKCHDPKCPWRYVMAGRVAIGPNPHCHPVGHAPTRGALGSIAGKLLPPRLAVTPAQKLAAAVRATLSDFRTLRSEYHRELLQAALTEFDHEERTMT